MPEQKRRYRKYKCYEYELCFGSHDYMVIIFLVDWKSGRNELCPRGGHIFDKI